MSENVAASLPLSGIRVLDFGQYIAAPSATMALRELGAEVIRIEPLHGEVSRKAGAYGHGMQMAFARGKKSVAIDLKTHTGRHVVERLIATADVIVHNFRADTADRLGLGAPRVHELNPRAVHASVSGFNAESDYADRPGLDIAAQAESGLMSVTGEQGGEPQRVGSPIVDAAAGDSLAQGILAALLARHTHGRGGVVQVSLIDAALRLQASTWGEYVSSGTMPLRSGNGQAQLAPAADLMQTADGHVVISAYQPAHWVALCELTGQQHMLDDPDLASAPQRAKLRDVWRTPMEGYFLARRTRDVLAELVDAGVVAGAVNTYADVLADDNLASSSVFVPTPDGCTIPASVAFRLDQQVDRTHQAPAAIGEHTEAVLQSAGFASHEVAELLAESVVAQAPPPAR